MTKRVRYDGPYEEVRVAVANQGDVYREEFVTVKRGGLLPTETDAGEPVPVSVRDDLIANNPDFSEVNQAAGKTKTRRKRAPAAPVEPVLDESAPLMPAPTDDTTINKDGESVG